MSSYERDLAKLTEEADLVEVGEKQCVSVTKPYRCNRLLDHDGCHFAWMEDDERVVGRTITRCHGTIRWVDKGERMKAAYPRKKAIKSVVKKAKTLAKKG